MDFVESDAGEHQTFPTQRGVKCLQPFKYALVMLQIRVMHPRLVFDNAGLDKNKFRHDFAETYQ